MSGSRVVRSGGHRLGTYAPGGFESDAIGCENELTRSARNSSHVRRPTDRSGAVTSSPVSYWLRRPYGSRLALHVTRAAKPTQPHLIVVHGGPGVADMAHDVPAFAGLATDPDVYVYDRVGTARRVGLAIHTAIRSLVPCRISRRCARTSGLITSCSTVIPGCPDRCRLRPRSSQTGGRSDLECAG